MMDVLTQVLTTLHLTGSMAIRAEFTAPWGIALAPGPAATFHLIEEGECWLQLDGNPAPIYLNAGDLVVVPYKRGHRLSDRLDGPPAVQLATQATPIGGWRQVRAGGGGARTTMVCGSFAFERHASHPLLALLPPLIHIRPAAADGPIRHTVSTLIEESRQSTLGAALVIQRLIDILFVQVLRVWLDQPGLEPGWLAGLRDPQVGAALQALHADPARAWSVAELGRHVGMSRSALAARFQELVGYAPMAYLTAWRLEVAANLLRTTDQTLGAILPQVGYATESALSTAFKRWLGVSPSTYRARARNGGSAGDEP